MSVSIDLGDTDVWDDSALVRSWNDALREYKKYHSIHAKGQKLSEALTKEEIALLISNGVPVEKSADAVVPSSVAEDDDGDAPMSESEEEIATIANASNRPVQQATKQQRAPTAPPEVFLNSVKDESTKNLMMAWYWAGYYTGLHEGQQQSATT